MATPAKVLPTDCARTQSGLYSDCRQRSDNGKSIVQQYQAVGVVGQTLFTIIDGLRVLRGVPWVIIFPDIVATPPLAMSMAKLVDPARQPIAASAWPSYSWLSDTFVTRARLLMSCPMSWPQKTLPVTVRLPASLT